MSRRAALTLSAVAFGVGSLWTAVGVSGQPGTSASRSGEWTAYHGDLRNHHYSPLDQIDASNFNKLEIVWRFKTDNLGTRPEFKLEGTPLMVGGVLYATAGTRRSVVALAPATGELLWVHSEYESARDVAAPRQLSGRGLSYWTDGKEQRILYVTPGFQLVALNAKTGVRVPGFGKDGLVDLKQAAVFGTGQPIDPIAGEIGLHATPAVTNVAPRSNTPGILGRRALLQAGRAFAPRRLGATPDLHHGLLGS